MNDPSDRTGRQRARGNRRSGSGPTVADVAERAGVSPMTVSRVVNGESNVSASTRQRVEQAIAALGYIPNAAARSLAGGQQQRIALLHANPSAAYLSEFLMGMLRSTSARTALIVEKYEAAERPADIVARILLHRAEAVVLPPPMCDDSAMIDALLAAGLAVAQVATGQPHRHCHAVMIDDARAARTMTEHLVALGHVRIGFIEGAPDQTASARRREGYEQAMRSAGLSVAADWIAAGDFTWRSGLAAAERLLDAGVSAIFASNDDMAAAAVAAAHRRGLDVPGALSVGGFDDSAMATTIWPELTTIRQPIADMAHEAMTLLGSAVTEASPARLVLPFALVVRGSTGMAGPVN